MCLDCGCMEPDNPMEGDKRHITMKNIVDAAKANNKSVEETLKTINETVRQVLDGKIKSRECEGVC